MFLRLFPFRRLLATSFLLVFANVFVGQCWCATANPAPIAPPIAALGQHNAQKPAHLGCQGHGAVAVPQGKHEGHPAKPARRHDCCKDKLASVLSSLTKPAYKHVFFIAPATLPVEFHFRPLAAQWDRTTPGALVPPQQLKPKIPDIRIFIQSLTV